MAVGAEPSFIKKMLVHMCIRGDLITGYSLCGAGGGGYVAVVMKEGAHRTDLEALINDFNSVRSGDLLYTPMTVHALEVDTIGIRVEVLIQ